MPFRRRGFSGRNRGMSLRPVDSMKNVMDLAQGLTGSALVSVIAKAKDNPLNSVDTDVSRGCVIKAIYLVIDVCGLAGTGVLNNYQSYLMKNPGDNLTEPVPGSEGTSNEKKFIIKTWAGMIMRNQDGNAPLHWEGWVKIPKRYQRMGVDDTWVLVSAVTATLTGHHFIKAIYKWYR